MCLPSATMYCLFSAKWHWSLYKYKKQQLRIRQESPHSRRMESTLIIKRVLQCSINTFFHLMQLSLFHILLSCLCLFNGFNWPNFICDSFKSLKPIFYVGPLESRWLFIGSDNDANISPRRGISSPIREKIQQKHLVTVRGNTSPC